MKKNSSRIVLLALAMTLFLTGCGGDKPAIMFNTRPVTPETVMDNSFTFKPGQRIYYLILMPKTVNSRFLYIQIIKKGKADRLGYELYWADTVRLKDEQMYYYTDYIVLNERGTYVMKVYSKDNPTKVLTDAQFFVGD